VIFSFYALFLLKKRYLWQKVLYSFSGWRFLLSSVRFRSSSFAHYLSLTGFHSHVNFSNSFRFANSRHLPLPGHHQENITLHHPFSQFPQRAHNYFIDVTELFLLYFIFFHSNRSVKKCDSFLFKILNTKLPTHFPRRYRTKPNIASDRGRTRNSRERKFRFPHSYCKSL
jgi:hypothetical protein